MRKATLAFVVLLRVTVLLSAQASEELERSLPREVIELLY